MPSDGRTLIPLARHAIAHALGLVTATPATDDVALREPGATFITLMLNGKLRGCIGSLHATRPLGEDVKANAVAAALRDPRFPPLTHEEYARVRVEVSVLSPLEPLPAGNEAEAIALLRPHVDGVVFRYGHHQSTFLPQVWEHFPEPRDFLVQLKVKAGLPPDFWEPQTRLHRYTVRKWQEDDTVPS